jgi:YHS domain-containing protein
MLVRTTVAIALALVGSAAGCQNSNASQAGRANHRPPAGAAQPSASTAAHDDIAPKSSTATLTRVTDRSQVCMVNNQFMARPQIPVEVDGRTYYGCCEMCKGRLAGDPSSRVATDPVSRNTVDKATAVIGRTSEGRTLYFENDQTFASYARGASR